jgi:hypothetical protein
MLLDADPTLSVYPVTVTTCGAFATIALAIEIINGNALAGASTPPKSY